MSGSKFDKTTLVTFAGAVTLGLAFSADARPLQQFVKGLIGSPTASQPASIEIGELRAELAQPALFRELETGELEELFQGMNYHLQGKDAEAVPILGKFALLGDVRAQSAIGGMFYFGKGLPLDPDEGIRWLQRAARQGGLPERQALAAALSGTWQWDHSSTEPEIAYAPSAPQVLQYVPALPAQTGSQYSPGLETGVAYGKGGSVSASAPIGARASVEQTYGAGSASRRYTDGLGNTPQIGSASPVILNQAGPGTYSDANGDIYTQAGPNGVVNTRTGEFSPTN